MRHHIIQVDSGAIIVNDPRPPGPVIIRGGICKCAKIRSKLSIVQNRLYIKRLKQERETRGRAVRDDPFWNRRSLIRITVQLAGDWKTVSPVTLSGHSLSMVCIGVGRFRILGGGQGLEYWRGQGLEYWGGGQGLEYWGAKV